MSEANKIKNPFVGPKPLTRNDKFYGREREQSKLFQLLDARRVILLHAPSGAGKTSLIQAGLIPQLEEDDFHVLPIARLHYVPADESTLNADFNRYAYSFILTLEEKQFSDDEERRSEAINIPNINSYLQSRLDGMEIWAPVVLVIDQFEEILKDPIDIDKKIAFFSQLGRALHELDLWALFVIRDDYMGALMDSKYVRHIPTRLVNTYHLDLFGKDAAMRAIKCTAEGCDAEGRRTEEAENDVQYRKFSDGAVSKLVDNLRLVKVQLPNEDPIDELGPYIEPVHLQVVCNRLWEKLPSGTTEITETELAAYGDVDQSLALFYADEIKKVAAEAGIDEREIRYWVQEELITRKGIRLPVLQESNYTRGLDNGLIEELVDAHLLRKETRGGRIFYELSHDRMVHPVLENNEEWFRQNLSKLQLGAELWKSGGEKDYLLLRGDQFLQAKAWMEENEPLMSALDTYFYQACLAEYEQQEKERLAEERERELAQQVERRNKFIVITMIAALIVALFGISLISGVTFMGLNATIKTDATSAAIPIAQATTNAAEAAINANATAAQATSGAVEGQISDLEATKLAINTTAIAVDANATHAAAAATEAGTNLDVAQNAADLAQATVSAAQLDGDSISNVLVVATAASNATATAQAARATISAANVTATAAAATYARFPADVLISVYSQPGGREIIERIRGPKRHRVLGKEGRWVEVQLRGDISGWLDLYLLTYEGPDSSSLGRGLEPLFVSNRTDLEFVFGSVIEETQGLKNPDDETSYSYLVPAKAEITVLEEVTGNKKYGSGRWLLIYYVDDKRVKKVYVPVEAVVER